MSRAARDQSQQLRMAGRVGRFDTGWFSDIAAAVLRDTTALQRLVARAFDFFNTWQISALVGSNSARYLTLKLQ